MSIFALKPLEELIPELRANNITLNEAITTNTLLVHLALDKTKYTINVDTLDTILQKMYYRTCILLNSTHTYMTEVGLVYEYDNYMFNIRLLQYYEENHPAECLANQDKIQQVKNTLGELQINLSDELCALHPNIRDLINTKYNTYPSWANQEPTKKCKELIVSDIIIKRKLKRRYGMCC